MLIIQRALSRELLYTGLVCALVLVLIFVAVRSLGFMSQVVAGVLPADGVLLLLALKLATYMDLLLPLVMYITVLLTLGRWSRDNELTAVAATGNGLAALAPPLALLLLAVAALTLVFSLFLGPRAVRQIDALEAAQAERLAVDEVVPGVFAHGRGGRGVYFVASRDEASGVLRKVFLYDTVGGGEAVVTAGYATPHTDPASGARWLILHDGLRYESAPAAAGAVGAADGGRPYRVIRFARHSLRIPQRAAATRAPPPRGTTTAALYAARNAAAAAEWHWRLSKIIMLPALLLLAVAFGHVPRDKHTAATLAAFLVYFAYSNLVGYGVGLIRGGGAPWAIYLLHGAVLAGAGCLYRRRDRNLPLWPWPWPVLRAAAGAR